MKLFLSAIIFLVLFCNSGKSQDIHFSQYHEAPLLLNPALTGNNHGDWRAGINYREQWTKVAIPYTTLNTYFDKKVFYYSKVFMVGGYISIDQANSKGMTKVSIAPSLAYRFDYKQHIIKVGIQPGIGFYNLSKGLTHPDQFNYETGTFDNRLPTNDIPEKFSRLYADVAIGGTWSKTLLGLTPLVGVSFYHLNKPKTSIYSADRQLRIPVKTLANIRVPVKLTSLVQINPALLFLRQKKSQEMFIGADLSFDSKNFSRNIDKLFLGIHHRNSKSAGLHSVIFIGGAELQNIRFAFSYDEYFNSAKNSSAIGSTFEISITYTGINTFTDKFSIPCEIY